MKPINKAWEEHKQRIPYLDKKKDNTRYHFEDGYCRGYQDAEASKDMVIELATTHQNLLKKYKFTLSQIRKHSPVLAELFKKEIEGLK